MHSLLQSRPSNISIAHRIDLNLSAKFLEDIFTKLHCIPQGICSMCTLYNNLSVSAGNSRGKDDIKDDHTIILSLCTANTDKMLPVFPFS